MNSRGKQRRSYSLTSEMSGYSSNESGRHRFSDKHLEVPVNTYRKSKSMDNSNSSSGDETDKLSDRDSIGTLSSGFTFSDCGNYVHTLLLLMYLRTYIDTSLFSYL